VDKLVPCKSVTLEEVPMDWRDLVEDLIRTQNLQLGHFRSVGELEQYVDRFVMAPPEGISDNSDSPRLPSAASKEILALTLGLDPSEFNTKEEAIRLFEKRA
jgi:hypothetical protein